jgi:splicing factor 1
MQVNSAATSTTSTVSFTVTSDAVNPADVQLVQSTTSQPVLVHYQSHNDPWLSSPQANAPSVPSAVPVSNSLPNNSFQPTVSSFSIPPYTGQPPHMNTMARNPLPFPGPLPSIPNMQQPPPQFQANPSVGPPFGQPPGIVNPQPTPSPSVPPPVRPLQAPHASGGWPPLSPVTSQSQRPPQVSLSFIPVRPPISVSPLGAAAQQGPIAMAPPSNTPIHYHSQHPQVANINTSVPVLSRPLAQSFPSTLPQGPSSMQALPFPAGSSVQSPYPLPMQVHPMMLAPDTVRSPSPAFPQVGLTPGMLPSSVGSSCPPASAPANTSFNQASGATLRPPLPVAGNFTFRPAVSPSPTPEFRAAGSQMGMHGSINPGLSHAPFFSPGNQGLQRPLDGRPMVQPWMHAPPPHPAGPFPRNQLPVGFHPAVQPGGRMVPPPMQAPSNLSNFSVPRPFQFMPRPQQNPFVNSNRQGDNPNYDPFAPTAASGAKRVEAESEYEDLMASVGLK